MFLHFTVSVLHEKGNQRNLEYADELILLPLIVTARLVLNVQVEVQRRRLKGVLPDSKTKRFGLLELDNIFINVRHIRSESQTLDA